MVCLMLSAFCHYPVASRMAGGTGCHRLRCKSTKTGRCNTAEREGVTDLTLTIWRKLVKSIFVNSPAPGSMAAYMTARLHPSCVTLCGAVTCLRSWWQMVIITVRDISVSVSLSPPLPLMEACFSLFSSYNLKVGLRSQKTTDNRGLSSSSD